MKQESWTRRQALIGGMAGVATTWLSGLGTAWAVASSRLPVVFDALGEIRMEYSEALVEQILDSGTRAITVTITDPKAEEGDAFEQMLKDLADYNLYLRRHPRHYIQAASVAEVDDALGSGRLAVFYNLQDSTPIGADLTRVALLRRLGITSIQLTYNRHNRSGSGCFEDPDTGLTGFGRELISEMERQRVLLDLSHAGMRTMSEAISAANRPMIVSHTACKALRSHRRNTSDDNMRAVAANGGVVGITQIRTFLTDARRDNLAVYFDHLDHAIQVAGIEHIGIGSDRDHRVIPDTEQALAILLEEEGTQFTPDDWPLYLEELNGPQRMNVVRDGLRERGYSPAEIDKVMGGNVLRLYTEVIG